MTPAEVDLLELAKASLERLRGARREYMVPSSSRLTWTLESYLQLGIYRVVTIADGMAAEWNEHRYLNSAILARHLIETVAAWYRVLDRIHCEMLPKKQIRQIFVFTMQAMWGRKDDDPVLPVATNALTGIDRLVSVYPAVRNVYDQLSEFAHPNSDGHWTFAGTIDERTGFMTLNPVGRDDGLRGLIVGAAYCLRLADNFFEGYEDNIKGPLEELEAEFGNDISAWPGDPSITWRRT